LGLDLRIFAFPTLAHGGRFVFLFNFPTVRTTADETRRLFGPGPEPGAPRVVWLYFAACRLVGCEHCDQPTGCPVFCPSNHGWILINVLTAFLVWGCHVWLSGRDAIAENIRQPQGARGSACVVGDVLSVSSLFGPAKGRYLR